MQQPTKPFCNNLHFYFATFCKKGLQKTQYSKDGWYEQLGGDASPLADAILDRIIHDGYVIDIVPVDPSKDLSMREVYGLSKTDRM